MHNLAAVYRASGQTARGIPLLEHVLAVRTERLGASHPQTLLAMGNLATDYSECGRYADAEPILVRWLAEQKTQVRADTGAIALRQKQLGRCRLMQRKFVLAEQSLRDALAILGQRPNSAERYDTQSLLGATLAGLGKPADAEPLLVESATGLRPLAIRSAPILKSARAAAQRVVDLYESLGRSDDAARWRHELDALGR